MPLIRVPLIRDIAHKPGARDGSAARRAMTLLAAMALGAVVATHALAAEPGTMSGIGMHGGGQFAGVRGGEFRGALPGSAPSMPAPTFNPSNAYTVPQSPETPVSPGSPGSVFGDR